MDQWSNCEVYGLINNMTAVRTDIIHYNDVIMSTMASQITSLTIVYLTLNSRHRSKKTSKLRVTGLFAGNSTATGDFATQKASNTENVSIWWRHHAAKQFKANTTHAHVLWDNWCRITTWQKRYAFFFVTIVDTSYSRNLERKLYFVYQYSNV